MVLALQHAPGVIRRAILMDDQNNALFKHIPQAPTRRSKLALASFICANGVLAGLFLGLLNPWLAALTLLSVPAVVTGHLARRAFRDEREHFSNPGMATYGLALGYFGIALNLIGIASLFVRIR